MEDFEIFGSFRVHKSIVSGLLGWEPYYWNVLTLETRNRLRQDIINHFRSKLEDYSELGIERWHPEYINFLILKVAGIAISRFGRDFIYEHKKRLYEIRQANGVRCGAKKKNGQQCRARAVRGSGRCRHHGGKSTGPKTIEGKIKSLSGLPQYQRNPALLIEKRKQLIAEAEQETGIEFSAELDSLSTI